ncbi:MAG: hypothetical protein R2788_18880 [Saprospiraceae bacterium]
MVNGEWKVVNNRRTHKCIQAIVKSYGLADVPNPIIREVGESYLAVIHVPVTFETNGIVGA